MSFSIDNRQPNLETHHKWWATRPIMLFDPTGLESSPVQTPHYTWYGYTPSNDSRPHHWDAADLYLNDPAYYVTGADAYKVIGENGSAVGEVKNQGAFSSVTDKDGNVTVTVENDDLSTTVTTYVICDRPKTNEQSHISTITYNNLKWYKILVYYMETTTTFNAYGDEIDRVMERGSFNVYTQASMRDAFTDRGRSPNEVALNRVMDLPEVDPSTATWLVSAAYSQIGRCWSADPTLTPGEVIRCAKYYQFKQDASGNWILVGQ